MTAFRFPVRSVLAGALLTELVVTSMLIPPIQARENRAIDRHAAQSVGPSPFRTDRRTEARGWIPAPAAGAMTPAPSNQPGGVCDWGDNPMIC